MLERMEKVVQILTVAKNPILKSCLMRACSLSQKTFRKYKDLLLECGLLDAYPAIDLRIPGRPNRHRMIFQTSQKGIEFLRKYNELLTLLEISVKYYPQIRISEG